MSNPDVSTWRELCADAVFEHDPQKLKLKIEQCEVAIAKRLHEIRDNSDRAERAAIDEAARVLRALQVERLNYPKPTQ